MGSNGEGLKARLVAEYEAVVDKVLLMSGSTEGLTLDDIEELAHEIGAKAEQGVSQHRVVPTTRCIL